ncbi:MAG: hypothetical protein A3H70_05230 [Candidatus Komeilibacteria bacterium RIFCSPLOWO2_02_FULL_48_11]|uniref:Large ribosomal subunit protein bL25 n=1 Tax=Candidatus Komeilibacteria bacterium RIFCSPLOWO2_02_FULL_48_11 TaxID=1798553 RepID=A0A1G2BQT5_9BACT|nr:MAG: hypothetical protein A3H70_05230 [Candidatus Komeilibacteria bacterium RIFCSPLOWO2_02_FULL_48_11]
MPNAATITLKKRPGGGSHEAVKTRRAGEVPGVIYGEGVGSRNFSIPAGALKKLMRTSGKSSLFDVRLDNEDKTVKAILQDWQNDPVSGQPVHIDLYQVRMDKVLHTKIPLHFTDASLAVKDLGGTLVKQLNELEIECLPAELIHSLEVSIEPLKTFVDHIKVKDLKLPAGIKSKLDPETIVLSVSAPRSEAELAALSGEVKADVSAIEVLTEKKEKVEGEGEGEKEGKTGTPPVEKK